MREKEGRGDMMREVDEGGNDMMEDEGKWWRGGGWGGRNDKEDEEEGNTRAQGRQIEQSQPRVGGWTMEQSYGSTLFSFVFGLVNT